MKRWELEQLLQKKLSLPLSLKLNQNRSHFISLKRDNERLKLSLHKNFLAAPLPLLEDLSLFLRGGKLSTAVRKFLDEAIVPSPPAGPQNCKGQFWDLNHLKTCVEKEYFHTSFLLHMGWFGEKTKKKRGIVLGKYVRQDQSILLHRLLDQIHVPLFFIRFIIYHELLHHIHPPIYLKNGRRSVHTPAFKQAEKKFKEWEAANAWLHSHVDTLFLTR